MKIRTDFVTNSSSSSFIIRKVNLTEEQIAKIERHGEFGKQMGLECPEWQWNIMQDDQHISGSTIIDNFDMNEFLSLIGVPSEVIMWEDFSFDDLEWLES